MLFRSILLVSLLKGINVLKKIDYKEIISILMIMAGALIAAFSVACILLPNDAIDYGTAGIAIIVSKLTGILIAFNACVYIAAFLLINRNSALLSLLVYVVATTIIDHFTDRFEAIKQVTIITKNPEPIIKWIKNDMKKTCTVMNSSGAVAGENKTVICYVTYFELQKIREAVKLLEENSFVTVSTIDEIIR